MPVRVMAELNPQAISFSFLFSRECERGERRMKAGGKAQGSEQTRAMTEAVEGLLVSCEGILAQASSAPSAVRPIVKRPLCPDALQQRAASHAPAAAGGRRRAEEGQGEALVGRGRVEERELGQGQGRARLPSPDLTLNPSPNPDTEPTQVEHGILPPTLPLSRPVSTFRTRRRGGRARASSSRRASSTSTPSSARRATRTRRRRTRAWRPPPRRASPRG